MTAGKWMGDDDVRAILLAAEAAKCAVETAREDINRTIAAGGCSKLKRAELERLEWEMKAVCAKAGARNADWYIRNAGPSVG